MLKARIAEIQEKMLNIFSQIMPQKENSLRSAKGCVFMDASEQICVKQRNQAMHQFNSKKPNS